MNNYEFEYEKDNIFYSYFGETHKAHLNRDISDSDIGGVFNEIRSKYELKLKELFTRNNMEYTNKTFDEEYAKGNGKYCH